MRKHFSPIKPPQLPTVKEPKVKRYLIPAGMKTTSLRKQREALSQRRQRQFARQVAEAKQAVLVCRNDSPHHYLILWRVYFNIRTKYNNHDDRYYLASGSTSKAFGCGYQLADYHLKNSGWHIELYPETITALAEIAEEDGVPEEVFDWSSFPFWLKVKLMAKVGVKGSAQATYHFCRNRVMLTKKGENWQLKISHKPLPERLKELPPPSDD